MRPRHLHVCRFVQPEAPRVPSTDGWWARSRVLHLELQQGLVRVAGAMAQEPECPRAAQRPADPDRDQRKTAPAQFSVWEHLAAGAAAQRELCAKTLAPVPVSACWIWHLSA